MAFGMEKPEWWLPNGEKILKIIRFDRMYERDEHTQTDRHCMTA